MNRPRGIELREFLRVLTPAQAEKLSEFMEVKVFRKSHRFCKAGAKVKRKNTSVLFILEGEISVTSDPLDADQEPIVRTMECGEMFGLVSFLASEKYTATCRAETIVRAATLSHADFDRLCEADVPLAAAFMLSIARQLAKDVRACNSRLATAIGGKSAAE